MNTTSSLRNRPLVALRALAALSADPDDLPQVFTIIDSLPGRAPGRLAARFRSTPSGKKLLATRPNLAARLADRDALRALPEGTVGRAYVDFVERAGISPEGIIAASIEGSRVHDQLPDEMRWTGDRMRDTHDLWHVVTGYGTDLVGEAAVLAFSYAQTKNPGVGLIVLLGMKKGDANVRRTLFQAYRRGRRAAWLVDVAWESMLERPLAEVRKELLIDEMPAYEAVTSAALRETGSITNPRPLVT